MGFLDVLTPKKIRDIAHEKVEPKRAIMATLQNAALLNLAIGVMFISGLPTQLQTRIPIQYDKLILNGLVGLILPFIGLSIFMALLMMLLERGVWGVAHVHKKISYWSMLLASQCAMTWIFIIVVVAFVTMALSSRVPVIFFLYPLALVLPILSIAWMWHSDGKILGTPPDDSRIFISKVVRVIGLWVGFVLWWYIANLLVSTVTHSALSSVGIDWTKLLMGSD